MSKSTITEILKKKGYAGEKLKKKYEKPKVTRISLDAKCAVLGYCKASSGGVPGSLQEYCSVPAPCSAYGT